MKEKELDRLTNLKSKEIQLYQNGIQTICGIDEAGKMTTSWASSNCSMCYA